MEHILDKNRQLLQASFGLENPEEYDLVTLWILGTYFLKHVPDMKVARFFGMLGFVSAEEASGKSTALNTVARLSYKPFTRGKKTVAAILDKVFEMEDKNTVPLDEIHKQLGVDERLDDLFNLGYEWDTTIERKNRGDDGQKDISAYFPKPFAGLADNKIASDTASRCLIIQMFPKEEYHGDIDITALANQNEENLKWSEQPETIQALMDVSFPEEDIDFMHNRKRQILRLMLAIAKITSEEWYQRAIAALKFFVTEEDRERGMNHKVLLALYRIKELKLYDEGQDDLSFIWTNPMMDLLHSNGIPDYIKDTTVSKFLRGYDKKIKPKGIGRKVNDHFGKRIFRNNNGYEWHLFDKAFRYITKKEREDVGREKQELYIDRLDNLYNKETKGSIDGIDHRIEAVPVISQSSTYKSPKGPEMPSATIYSNDSKPSMPSNLSN